MTITTVCVPLEIHALLSEVYSTQYRIMFQRVRTAGRVLVGNFWKIYFQGLPCFLYASKRCLSNSSYGIFFLVLERSCSSSLEHPSSSLLGPGSLSLRPLSSLEAPVIPRNATALRALPCWSRARVASLWIECASAAVDRVVPLDERPGEAGRLKPVTRNDCCSSGLIVKSSIFPTWPMLSISRAS